MREGDGELHIKDEQGKAHWTLNALTRVAQERGIRVKRSQIRRVFLKEGIPWRQPRSWADSPTRSSSQKNAGRHALHATTVEQHRLVCRRVRSHQPAYLSTCTGLVA